MDVATRWGPLDGLTAQEISEWSGLGHDAPWSSPFVMPEFVLPAAQWLAPEPAPHVLRVFDGRGPAARLLGVACLVELPPDLFSPLPRLGSFLTLHSFRTGVLAREGAQGIVADALVRFARDSHHGLAFDKLAVNDPLSGELSQSVARAGGKWHQRTGFERPVWRLDGGTIDARLPSSLRKDLARRLRRLREQGEVAFRLLRDDAADADAVETHLRLEHQGWKREAGTSMLASDAEAAFFRDMCARFRDSGALVFGELLLDGAAIASSSNIRLGRTLHAFKGGWAPDYARYSPGRLNEWLLMQAIPDAWPRLECFDSMAGGDGHMGELLPDREAIAAGVYSLGTTGNLAMRAARAWRPLAYRLARG